MLTYHSCRQCVYSLRKFFTGFIIDKKIMDSWWNEKLLCWRICCAITIVFCSVSRLVPGFVECDIFGTTKIPVSLYSKYF